jgi:SAM-dependent methyltransferase
VKRVQFDEEVASHYDETSAHMYRPEVIDPTVDFLEAHARGGRALEFGIGTGRIALPLSARGVPVHGLDISEPMLDEMRRKPGAEDIGLTVGDFASARVEGEFRLVYLLFNTIMNLTSQDEQVECFQNAAAHLEPGGRFLVEAIVPDLRRLTPGERVRVFDLGETHLGFDEYTDFTAQILHSHHYWVGDGQARSLSAPFRYVWPSELDLMARLAGLSFLERWADWERSSFADESNSHVTVWEKAQ